MLSVQEAADRLKVSRLLIHRRIQDGTIKAVKVGNQYVIDEKDLPKTLPKRKGGRPAHPKK